MRIKLTEKNMLIWLLIILGGLLFLRAVSTVFIYPLLLISLAIFTFAPFKVCLPTLCFLLPFANIIKLQPGQISFFTVFFLIYVIRTLLKKDALRRVFLLSLLFFAGYAFVFSGTGKIITIATMVCGFAMLHDACKSDEYDYKEVLYAFCMGIIFSSILGLFKEQLPIVDSFVQEATQKIGHKEYVERFVGLNVNPNYYTMDISVVLACLTVMMVTSSKPSKVQVLMFVGLSVFGLMSVSKSFLLIWVLLLAVIIFYGFLNGGTSFFRIIIMFAVMAVFIYFFAKESIDTYIYRLTEDSDGDMSGITTGRIDIWISYIKAILKSERVLLFGAGLGEILERGTHNTYLEALYGLGLVGTMFYAFVLRMSLAIKSFPKRLVYYIPVIVMLIRFMGIGVFIHDSLWYYLVIISLSLIYADKCNKKREISDLSNANEIL